MDDSYYSVIPDKQNNPAYGIPQPGVNGQQAPTPSDDTNQNATSDGVYHSLVREKDEEHNYSSMTPGSGENTAIPHAPPNAYQVVPF